MDKFKNAFSTTNLIMYGSSIIVVASILVVELAQFPFMSKANDFLTPVVNILTLASMLFAALALIVAALAFKAAVAKPSLSLRIQAGHEPQNHLKLPIHRVTGGLLRWADTSSWRLWIDNTGASSARYVVVEITFGDGIRLDPHSFPAWAAIPDESGTRYRTFRWYASDMVLHPNFPLELPKMPFDLAIIDTSGSVPQNLNVDITVAADGFYTGPVKHVISLDYEHVNYEMEEWIINAFSLAGSSQFTVPMGNGGGRGYYTSQLSREFGPVVPPTYEHLCSTRLAQSEMWKRIFDEWKMRGIVQ